MQSIGNVRRELRDSARVAHEIASAIACLHNLAMPVTRRAVNALLTHVTGHGYRAAIVAGFVLAYQREGVVVLGAGNLGGTAFEHTGNHAGTNGASALADGGKNGEELCTGNHAGTNGTSTGNHAGTSAQSDTSAVVTTNGASGSAMVPSVLRNGSGVAPDPVASGAAVDVAVGPGSAMVPSVLADGSGAVPSAENTDPRALTHVRAEIRSSSQVTGLWQNTTGQTPSEPTGVGTLFSAPLVFVDTNPRGSPATEIAGPHAAVENANPTDGPERSLPVGPVRNGGRVLAPTRAAGGLEDRPAEPLASEPVPGALAPVLAAKPSAPKQPALLLLGAPGTPATEFPWVTDLRGAADALLDVLLCHLTGEQRVTLGRYHAWRWGNCRTSEATNRKRGGEVAKNYAKMARSDQFMDLPVRDLRRLCQRYFKSIEYSPFLNPWLIQAIDDGYVPKPLPPKPIPTGALS